MTTAWGHLHLSALPQGESAHARKASATATRCPWMRRRGVLRSGATLSPCLAEFDGPPMDLANMRSLGVRSIFVTCEGGRRAAVDVSAFAGSTEVPALARRLRCSSCGSRPVDVRPNWQEQRASGLAR